MNTQNAIIMHKMHKLQKHGNQKQFGHQRTENKTKYVIESCEFLAF